MDINHTQVWYIRIQLIHIQGGPKKSRQLQFVIINISNVIG